MIKQMCTVYYILLLLSTTKPVISGWVLRDVEEEFSKSAVNVRC